MYTIDELIETFYGHRIAPTHERKIYEDFKGMLSTFKGDLQHFHTDATEDELHEAIMIGMQVMRRLDARHPNVYESHPYIGQEAFRCADAYLKGEVVKLPSREEDEALKAKSRLQRDIERTKAYLKELWGA